MILFYGIFIGKFPTSDFIVAIRRLPKPFQSGLVLVPRNIFRGSLIPRPTDVGGWVAIQSASRGSEIVRCRADYETANGQADSFECIGKFSLHQFMSSRHPTRGRKEFAPCSVVLPGKNKIILYLTFIDKIESLSKSPFLPIIRAILFLFYAWF